MEYIYAAMLLHKAGQKIDEPSLTKVLSAASVHVDTNRVKALVAALEGVNIEEAIASAAVVAAAPAAAASAAESHHAKKEEKPKAEEKKDTEAAAGLSALFG